MIYPLVLSVNRPLLFVVLLATIGGLRGEAVPFEFAFGGNELRGLIDEPSNKTPSSLIVIVHGHGKTDVQNGQWMNLRSTFTKLGITTVLWDKAGCGKSDGVYDHNQSVQSSAQEAAAAIAELRRRKIRGADHIGLWGISRAGWICPLVIKEDPMIAYWISVSGTDEKENFGYLLRSNLRIEGRTDSEIDLLYDEWLRGSRLFQTGGSWTEYLRATQRLRADPFYKEFFGESGGENEYLANQKKFLSERHSFDAQTGLMIYVPELRPVLSSLRCPVLAIFGEKDMNIDWRSTLKLYRETIGDSRLTVRTFPDGNHNLQKCQTGGWRENVINNRRWAPCSGYHECMSEWLKSVKASVEQ